MDFYNASIGFGLVLAGNTAAMNRYAHLSETQKNPKQSLRNDHREFSGCSDIKLLTGVKTPVNFSYL